MASVSLGSPAASVLVASTPLTILVVPLTPDPDAVQDTCRSSPCTVKGPNPPGALQLVVPGGSPRQRTGNGVCRSVMSAELVTVPAAGVPWVLAEMGPDGETVATLD